MKNRSWGTINRRLVGIRLALSRLAHWGSERRVRPPWLIALSWLALSGSVWPQETPPERARLQIQASHQNVVTHLAFSPDGLVLASSADDSTARLWEVSSGRLLRIIEHPARVRYCSWSADGQTLATCAGDSVRLWNPVTGQLRREISGIRETDPGPFGNDPLSWLPDGRFFATAMRDHSVRIWNSTTGAQLQVLPEVGRLPGKPPAPPIPEPGSTSAAPPGKRPAPAGPLQDEIVDANFVLWRKDGRMLATSEGRTLRLWDALSGQRLREINLEGNSRFSTHARGQSRFFTLDFSPDGALIATGGHDGSARVWEANTGKLMNSLSISSCTPNQDPGFVSKLAWNQDGTRLLAGTMAGAVYLWDRANGKVLRMFPGGNGAVVGASFCPDGNLLVSYHKALILWEADTGKVLREFPGQACLALSPDGVNVAVGSGNDREVRLWDLSTGKVVVLGGQNIRTAQASFSPVGQGLAIKSDSESRLPLLNLWNPRTGRPTSIGRSSPGWLDFSWCPNGNLIGYGQTKSQLWDFRDGRETSFPGSGPLFPSPDGRMVASLHKNVVKLWDAVTGRALRNLVGHSEEITDLCWGPDSSKLATSSQDKTARIWDVATGKEFQRFGHSQAVAQISWSPDGSSLATSYGKFGHGEFSLWDLASKRLRFRLPVGHLDNGWLPYIPQWTLDGRTLVTYGKLWNVATGKQRHLDEKSLSTDPSLFSQCLSPDGKTLFLGMEQSSGLWDSKTGSLIRLLESATRVMSCSWSSDSAIVSTVGVDGTTRLWDSATGAELCSVMAFSDGDWAAVSPEGFFDGSPRGLKEMHWVVGLIPYDLEQFFNEFYQPGLFKDILQMHRPISEILRDRKDPRASLSILSKDRRPVKVTFESPLTQCDQRKLDLTMRLQESGPDATHQQPCGIQDVKVFNNGVLVWRSPQGNLVPPGLITVSVPIVAGKNVITAYAFNRDNVKCRDVRTEIAGAQSLQSQGQAWVLTIGIDHYSDPQYNLNYAGADAKELATTLQANLPFPDRGKNIHVTTLLDEKATKQGILDALRKLASQAAPEDTVMVTYAGHGMNYRNHFYLLPHDLGIEPNPEQLAHCGISDEELEAIFVSLEAGHIALVLDACHSGQALESDEWRVGPMNARGLAQLAWEKGMDILTASQSDETAKEVSSKGHGLLTYALLEAFTMAPRRKGLLPARRWLDYSADQVPKMLGAEGDIQTKTESLATRGVTVQGVRRLTIQTPRVFHAHEDADWVVSH